MKSTDLMVCWRELDKRTNTILTSKMSAGLNHSNNIGFSFWFTANRFDWDKQLKKKPTRTCVDVCLTLRKADISQATKRKMRKVQGWGFNAGRGEERERERERDRGTFHDLLISSGEKRESKLFAARSSLEFLITSRERLKWVWHVCLCVAGTWMS